MKSSEKRDELRTTAKVAILFGNETDYMILWLHLYLNVPHGALMKIKLGREAKSIYTFTILEHKQDTKYNK